VANHGAPPLAVADEDRTRLDQLVAGPDPVLATRARVVLLAAGGASHAEITRQLSLSRPTVLSWRTRYAESGLAGLGDRARSGRPRTVAAHEVVDLTLRRPAGSAAGWTARSLAEHLGVGRTTVSRAWQAYGVRPAPDGRFRFATEPGLAARGGRPVAVHLDPEDRLAVVAVDGRRADRLVWAGGAGPLGRSGGRQALSTLLQPGAPGLREALAHPGPSDLTGLLDAAYRTRGGLLLDARLHVVAADRATLRRPEVAAWLAVRRDVVAHAVTDPATWAGQVAAWVRLGELRPGTPPLGDRAPLEPMLRRAQQSGATIAWTSVVREGVRRVTRPSS
jgi:transposase